VLATLVRSSDLQIEDNGQPPIRQRLHLVGTHVTMLLPIGHDNTEFTRVTVDRMLLSVHWPEAEHRRALTTPVFGPLMDRILELGDLIAAFSPQPGRCFRMMQSRQLQATHCHQPPTTIPNGFATRRPSPTSAAPHHSMPAAGRGNDTDSTAVVIVRPNLSSGTS